MNPYEPPQTHSSQHIPASRNEPTRRAFAPEYRRPLWRAVEQQLAMTVLCVLMLDGGQMARLCGIAMAAFWGGASFVLVRRPTSPTAGDLWYLRAGFLPMFLVLWSLVQLLA